MKSLFATVSVILLAVASPALAYDYSSLVTNQSLGYNSPTPQMSAPSMPNPNHYGVPTGSGQQPGSFYRPPPPPPQPTYLRTAPPQPPPRNALDLSDYVGGQQEPGYKRWSRKVSDKFDKSVNKMKAAWTVLRE